MPTKGLITLLFVFVAFSQNATAAISPFLIRPYLYTIKGEKWALSWSFNFNEEAQSMVKLQVNGLPVFVQASLSEDLYTAVLPLPQCEFGDVTYAVEGMAEPQKINDIPCAESSALTKFSFMADTQEGQNHDKIFSDHVAKFNGSALLIAGDLVETGSVYKEWLGLFDALSSTIQNQILIPVVGNHEYHGDKLVSHWRHFFQTEASEDFFALDLGPVHAIALNSCFSDDPSLRLRQLNWLDLELAKPNRWKIVFFHHPPFSRSIMNSKEYPKKEWKILQQDYVPLFERYHVDLVLNGHTHLFEHSEKSGVQYLTMGPAGGIMGTHGSSNPYTLASEKLRTILEVEVNQTHLRAVTSTIEGNQIGELNLTKVQIRE
jgi:predicted phosphodiesterase